MKKIKLGTLLSEINEKTTENNQFEVLTSSQNGIVSQSDYFNKQVASTDTKGYKIVRKGQFTYRSMSDTGKFYINMLNDKDIGIVSPAYPVFELNSSSVLPRYLELYFKSNYFQRQISNQSTGSTRLALKYKKLCDLDFIIPSIDTQKEAIRVFDLIHNNIEKHDKALFLLNELIKSRFICQEVSLCY